ncbi:MAG: chromosomal replication initiator protein [Neolewinella sp.]
MNTDIFWADCLKQLETEVSAETVNNWVLPLQPILNKNKMRLLAPNRYVYNYIKRNLVEEIRRVVLNLNPQISHLEFDVGTYEPDPADPAESADAHKNDEPAVAASRASLNPLFVFDTHVEGKSNQLSRAAAMQVGNNPGSGFNPLFIYGGVGLGKTHLMQAAGNLVLDINPSANVVYIRSEVFVADMVTALKTNKMDKFKKHYRSLDVLLIDDIQFFAGKNQTQEEFFHTFNELLEGQRQIIITSDRIPQAISGVEERLISRFGSGLTVEIEAPELETRVAILETKAQKLQLDLDYDVAFFIANVIHSNVRELEGALHRISAYAQFTNREINTDLARDALKDLLIYKDRQLNVDNIQRLVADYFNIRISDLLSKNRSRSIARPRQIAMAFAKQYTNLSLPKIGSEFGGRDHTTVIHACKKVDELLKTDLTFEADFKKLHKIIGG